MFALIVVETWYSIYRLTQNFFDPLLTSKGQPYFRVAYKNIVEEQTLIGYLTNGGVTFGDTEKMSPHDRKLVLDFMKEVNDQKKKAIEESKAAAESKMKAPKDPKTLGVR